MVYLLDTYSRYISVDKSKCSKVVLWLTINSSITACKETINVGIVYIPPCNSKYAAGEPYIELQQELARYCQNSNHVILMGDFNSRTGLKDDYSVVDHYFTEQFGLECIENESIEILNNFQVNNTSLSRSNKDWIVNAYGNQM